MTEIEALIEDLGLVQVGSEEYYSYINSLDRFPPFEDCQYTPVYDNLCELMYKRNRKYSRFAPCSLDLQLKLSL